MDTKQNALLSSVTEFLRELNELKIDGAFSADEAIAHQILTNSLEEAYLKIDRALNPSLTRQFAGIVAAHEQVQILELSPVHLEAAQSSWARYANRHSYLLLSDDGHSFKMMICQRDTQDARVIYESESVQ